MFFCLFFFLVKENPAINNAVLLAYSPDDGFDWRRNG